MVSTMLRLRSVVDDLNQNELGQRGLSLRVVYDETKYIHQRLTWFATFGLVAYSPSPS